STIASNLLSIQDFVHSQWPFASPVARLSAWTFRMARENPRRTFLIVFSIVFALLAVALLLSRLAHPLPKVNQEPTKGQEDKDRRTTRKICGSEYEEKAKMIRTSCEEIKKMKHRLSSFLFELLHSQKKENGGLQQMCCKDGCNQIELEESLCWEAPPSPILPHDSPSPTITLALLLLGASIEMAAMFLRQLLFSDLPALVDKAKAHPRRTISFFILLTLFIGFIIIVCSPSPHQVEKTKEQRDKEEHENRAICGAEFDRLVEETRSNCDQIKARNVTV
ncbi:hypothetical protein PRIPAC_96022, partial [Pristionchus pacificus]|uniref:Uncharacterized protein n=1 Tax=Pristionchus pacificus TaxID=54126 RepID=A0A2A6D1J9_PRIPA